MGIIKHALDNFRPLSSFDKMKINMLMETDFEAKFGSMERAHALNKEYSYAIDFPVLYQMEVGLRSILGRPSQGMLSPLRNDLRQKKYETMSIEERGAYNCVGAYRDVINHNRI